MAHDKRAHVGINRTHHYLRTFTFLPDMKKRISTYINACFSCRSTEPDRHPPIGDLHPIDTPRVPLSVLYLDFVVSVPVSSNGHDSILLITCKTSKFVRYIFGKTTYTTED